MRAAASVLGLVIALAIGYCVYHAELAGASDGASVTMGQADLAGVKADLLSIGQAERLYLAGHDTYATLDQLQQEGSIAFRTRHGYGFSVEADDAQHFKVTATPVPGSNSARPTFSTDETLQITGP